MGISNPRFNLTQAQIKDIEIHLETIWSKGEVREIRLFNQGNIKGHEFFNNPKEAAEFVKNNVKKYEIIITLNPCNVDKLNPKKYITSKEILHDKYLLIDIDPVRPSKTQATNEEIRNAKSLAEKIKNDLGTPLYFAMSGNGYHLVYKHNANSINQIKQFLSDLDLRYSNQFAKVDIQNSDIIRLAKIIGTFSRKGTHSKQRPFRRSHILEYNQEASIVLNIPKSPQQPKKSKGTRIKSKWWLDVTNFMDGKWSSFYESRGISKITDNRHNNFDKRGFTAEDHSNKVGNFVFNSQDGCYYDFKSKTHGNSIDFLMNIESMTKQEAIKELSKYTGIKSKKSSKTTQSSYSDNLTFVEKNHKTYIISEEGDVDTIHAHFTARILEKIFDDNKKISWKIELSNKQGKITQKAMVELLGSELVNPNKFIEKIGDVGAFLYNESNRKKHNLYIQYLLEKDNVISKMKTQHLGRTRRKKYLFSNAIATPLGREEIKQIIPPSGSRMKLNLPENLIEFWREKILLLHQLYGKQLWKKIGFNVATVFADEIVEEFGFFPLLFLNGPKGHGKSTCFTFSQYFFGVHRQTRPHNFSSTAKSFYREAMRYRGIPLILNEYQHNKKNNSLAQSLYDREGYHRAKTSNDLETHHTEINATFIVASTRDIAGYESDAVLSRMVVMDFALFDPSNKDTKEIISKINKDKDLLSSFVSLALSLDPQALIEQVHTEASKYNMNSRIVENHCIFQAAANLLFKALGLEDLIVNDISLEIKEHNTTTQQSNAAHHFVALVSALVANDRVSNGVAKVSNADQKLYFHLRDIYPDVKRFCGQIGEKDDIPDKRTLGRLLKQIGAENKTSRELQKSISDKPRKVWCIDINEEDI